MKIVEMNLKEYLDKLYSSAPAPGGGSASALTAAQGVALVCMVANLTIGKPRYADFEKNCEEVMAEAENVYKGLVEAIDKDTEAYTVVSKAYKLPKETEEEKTERSKAIAEATLVATQVPYDTMVLCMEGLKLTERMVGKSNPNASSDLGVAALNLLAAVKSAWLNVKINLPGVKIEEEALKFRAAESLLAEAEERAERIYKEVADSL